MTEPERTGGITRIKEVSLDEADEIQAAGLGVPKLYYDGSSKELGPRYFCEPAELERWRQSHQAGGAHS